jgi:hypothetical protein
LETFDVLPEYWTELTGFYNEIIKDLQEDDKNAGIWRRIECAEVQGALPPNP